MGATPLRLALVGAGAIAAAHARVAADVDGVSLDLVVDRHAERATRLAAACGARSSDRFEDVSTGMDGVLICTSSDSHAALAHSLLDEGLPVLVEKPVALTMGQLDEVLSAAQTSGTPLVAGHVRRHDDACAAIAREIASGRAGEVRLARIAWHAGNVWPGGWRGWQLDPDRSGGHFVHNGVHAFDLLAWIFGRRPERVHARGVNSWAPGQTVPDTFQVALDLGAGGVASVELSYALRPLGRKIEKMTFCGTRRTLTYDSTRKSRHVTNGREASMDFDRALRAQLTHFRDVIRGDASTLVTPDELRNGLATALAAQRSYESATAVDVPAELG